MTKTLSKIKHSVQGTIYHSEGYLSKLIKYIPSEVIALYLTLDSILRSSDQVEPIYQRLYWGIFVFGLVATPLYQYRIQKLKNWFHLLISTIAFAVWVIAIGGPF